jgi:tetratricopeptide (TPR) repeat protein
LRTQTRALCSKQERFDARSALALGRREDALQATDEAVGIYRKLARARPAAFLAYLATSLNNLGIRHSELGRREDALQAADEAVGIYCQLMVRWPHLQADLDNSLGLLEWLQNQT